MKMRARKPGERTHVSLLSRCFLFGAKLKWTNLIQHFVIRAIRISDDVHPFINT